MIERVQTIFLFLSAIQSVVVFVGIPLWIDASGIQVDIKNNTLICLPLILGCFMSLIIIFSYKNRLRQMKLCRINIIFNILIIALYVFLLSFNNFQSLLETNFRFGFFIPLINFLLLTTALYYIKKDDDLIKSIDRVR